MKKHNDYLSITIDLYPNIHTIKILIKGYI